MRLWPVPKQKRHIFHVIEIPGTVFYNPHILFIGNNLGRKIKSESMRMMKNGRCERYFDL
jgi:hypothetical protein